MTLIPISEVPERPKKWRKIFGEIPNQMALVISIKEGKSAMGELRRYKKKGLFLGYFITSKGGQAFIVHNDTSISSKKGETK